MEDLKPCPFCGSDDIRACAFEISPECYIECCNCGARIDAEILWGDSDIQEHDNACLKALRKRWNRRSAAPAADVAPVVHGKWYHTGEVEWSCTNCGNVIATKDSWECPTKQYCDECGARLEGGKENAAD